MECTKWNRPRPRAPSRVRLPVRVAVLPPRRPHPVAELRLEPRKVLRLERGPYLRLHAPRARARTDTPRHVNIQLTCRAAAAAAVSRAAPARPAAAHLHAIIRVHLSTVRCDAGVTNIATPCAAESLPHSHGGHTASSHKQTHQRTHTQIRRRKRHTRSRHSTREHTRTLSLSHTLAQMHTRGGDTHCTRTCASARCRNWGLPRPRSSAQATRRSTVAF